MSIIDVRLVRGRDGVWRASSGDAEARVYMVQTGDDGEPECLDVEVRLRKPPTKQGERCT